MQTLKEALAKYPQGFSVGPKGAIYKIEQVSSHLVTIAERNPLPPASGGYLVVSDTEDVVDGTESDTRRVY